MDAPPKRGIFVGATRFAIGQPNRAHPVAAFLLGAVQGGICRKNKGIAQSWRFRALAPRRAQATPATPRLMVTTDVSPRVVSALAAAAREAFGHVNGFFLLHGWQQDRKFLAAVTPQHGPLTQCLTQNGGNRAQHTIASQMAIPVC